MENILSELLSSIISGANSIIDLLLNNLMETCFYPERTILNADVTGVQISLNALKSVILSFAVALIILKFLKKGFDLYVLWTEGESELPIGTYIMYFARAIIVALSFDFLFDLLIEVAIQFGTELLNSLALDNMLPNWGYIVEFATTSLFSAFTGLVATVLFIILYIQFLVRGIEILLLRLGFPLASIGLLEANSGVFQSYSQKMYKSVLTVIVQIILCKLGLALIFTSHWFYAIATIVMAIKTPSFLQEFMLTGGSGGISAIIMNASKSIELSRQIKNIYSKAKWGG